jgi:hypothetical protein
MWTKVLGLSVVGLAAVGLTFGQMAFGGDPTLPARVPGNVNVIQNSGNCKSNTLIVEQGRDGRPAQSVFFSDASPAAERVPAAPVPVDPPLPPLPTDLLPTVPAVPASDGPTMEGGEMVLRIPVPQVPRIQMPQLPPIQVPSCRKQVYQVPSGKTMVFDGPGGRTMVSSSGYGNSTVIVGNGQRTTVLSNGPGMVYRGSDRFWTKSVYSRDLGTTLYYDPRTTCWFRYSAQDDLYRMVPDYDD